MENTDLTPRILLAYGVLALLTAFYPVLFGELPAPLGAAVQLLPEGGEPPDRNDELGDIPTQVLPPRVAAADAWRRGRLPLRFSAQGCGEPLLANPVAQAVTPTMLFFLVFPAAWASAAAAAVHLFLAAAGAFFLARSRGLRPVAACWAGLAFGFSLYFTTWMHFPQPWAQLFFPWALLALERVAKGGSGGFAATFAMVLLLMLGGYPESEFFVAVVGTAFFFVVLLRERAPRAELWRRFGRAAGASILALGLTAAYTLPVALAIIRSERSVQIARARDALRPPAFGLGDFLRPPIYWEVARFWVVPEAQGNPRDLDKFGPYSFAGRTGGYAGILVLAFALATFFWRRAPRPVVWARFAAVLTALYVLWYPPLVYFLQATPGLREIAWRLTSNRANGILLLLLGLLAAFELDRIRDGGRTIATRMALGIALAVTALVTLEFARTADRPPLSAWRAVSFVLPALLLAAAFPLLAHPLSRRRCRALVILLLAGTGVDLLRIGARFNPGTRPEDYFPVTPKVREIATASRGGRFASSEIALTGMAYMYGLEDVRVHDAMAPADYEDVLGATTGYTGPAEYAARVTRLEAPFLDFLNVRARLGPGGALESRQTPPAAFPERLIGARDAGDLLDRLSRESDFERNAYFVGPGEAFAGSAAVLSVEKPRPEELRLRVRTDFSRVLAVPETTDGGWRAEGNRQRLPTLTVNGAFLGIRVPAGETTIVCRYLPPGFRTGLAISSAAFLLTVAMSLSRFRTGARSSSRSTGEAASLFGGIGRVRRRRRPGAGASASEDPP